ncbi:MAG: hypothetical protein AAFQ17_08165 [Pseudomonadota bacterium]
MTEALLEERRPLEGFEVGGDQVHVASAPLAEAFAVTLPAGGARGELPEIGQSTILSGWFVMGVGAARWLVVSRQEPTPPISDVLRACVPDGADDIAITSQSDGIVPLTLEGPLATDVLARLVSIDLDQIADGGVVTTLIEHMTVTLTRVSRTDFILIGASSTADDFAHAVATAVNTVQSINARN